MKLLENLLASGLGLRRNTIVAFLATYLGWLAFQLGGLGFYTGMIVGVYGLAVFVVLGLCIHLFYAENSFLKAASQQALTSDKAIILLIALPIVIYIRYAHIDFVSHDYSRYLSVWYGYIQMHGLAAYKDTFTNYAPLYTYMLGIPALMTPYVVPLIAIKAISFTGELVAAFYIYKITGLKYGYGTQLPLLASIIFLLLPTVIINSAFIAQSDIWYTAFELAFLYYVIRNRPFPGIICFGVAFAFKLQTVFLGPFLLILILNRKLPWYYLAVVPAVYGLTCVPAWLEGRPFADLLSVYVVQAHTGNGLSHHAPNLYILFPKHFAFKNIVKCFGIGLTVVLMTAFSIRHRNTLVRNERIETYIFLALASVALTVFFLPKMHDRYFFPADVLSLLFAILVSRFWPIPVFYQIISGLSIYKFNDIHYFLSHHVYLFVIATLLNVVVSLWLFRKAVTLDPENLFGFFCTNGKSLTTKVIPLGHAERSFLNVVG